jgi:hypothetical protein
MIDLNAIADSAMWILGAAAVVIVAFFAKILFRD